jgi:hypothetical protein
MNRRFYKDAREGVYCNIKTKAENTPLTCDIDPYYIEDISPDYGGWTDELIKALNHKIEPYQSINLPGRKYWNNQEYKPLLRHLKTDINSEEIDYIGAWESGTGDGFSMELYNYEGMLCRIDLSGDIMDAMAINWLKLREIK